MKDGGRRTLEVHVSFSGSPEEDLGREEVLMETAAEGRPALACWSWRGPVVVLGHGQPEEDVDRAFCRQNGIPVLRRITGGTGIVHSDDLAVSLAVPAGHPEGRTIAGLYGLLLDVIQESLAEEGIAVERPSPGPSRKWKERSRVCFEDVLGETLMLDGRKVVGCAQLRRRRAVLVHAHVHLALDPLLYAGVFRVPAERVAHALGTVAGLSPGRLARRIALTASRRLGFEGAAPTGDPGTTTS